MWLSPVLSVNQLKSHIAELTSAPLVYGIHQAVYSTVREPTVSSPAIASDIGCYLLTMSVALNKQWRFVNCLAISFGWKIHEYWIVRITWVDKKSMQ